MKISLRQKLKIYNDKHRAFTLIELLVVIAIIGILASVVVVNVGSGRVKARDAKRISDLKAIQTAVELYFDDTGSYPGWAQCNSGKVPSYWNWSNCTNDGNWDYTANDIAYLLTNKGYLSTMPKDPINKGGVSESPFQVYGYEAWAVPDANQVYYLCTRLEGQVPAGSRGSGNFNYCLYGGDTQTHNILN